MRRGLVFGKFYPFHVGHEALIRFARAHCDELIVLACISDKELIPEQQRLGWIQQTFSDDQGIIVQGLPYLEAELPNTSVSSREISRVWAERFRQALPPVDLVVTGEDYGDYVAEFLGIEHLRYNGPRTISGTQIRRDLEKNWGFLNQVAQEDLLTKIVILGTESSGKSSLAKYLAERFGGGYVSEAGRELIPDSRDCTPEDLEKVAARHAELIEEASRTAKRALFIDTDIHTTMSYSEFLFGKELEVSPEVLKANQAHLYLYLDNDAPFVQDGTRLDEAARNALDRSHRRVLDQHGINYRVLSGSWEEKYEEASRLVEHALSVRYPWSEQAILPPLPKLQPDIELPARPSVLEINHIQP